LLPHEERPDRGPDDGEQERHPPKLAKAENVNDIKKDGVFADYAYISRLERDNPESTDGPDLARMDRSDPNLRVLGRREAAHYESSAERKHPPAQEAHACGLNRPNQRPKRYVAKSEISA
jgi:hypothetical protein